METKKINEEFLNEICRIAINLDCKLLFIWLTIMAKELAEYLACHAYVCPGIDCFRAVYNTNLNEDRIYWELCGNKLFKKDYGKDEDGEDKEIPFFAEEAAACCFIKSINGEEPYSPEEQLLISDPPPTDEEKQLIEDERKRKFLGDLFPNPDEFPWLSYPGWAMVKEAIKKLKELLCAGDVPFEDYENGNIEKKAMVEAIAGHLLKNEFTCHKFWYPFVVFLSILIVKTSKMSFCDDEGDCC